MKLLKIWIFIALFALVLGACSTLDTKSITVTDDLGREISLENPPVKIISLAPSNTEIIYAIGAGDLMVGRDEVSDFPAEVLDLPPVGGWEGYNLETITSLQPDLVLAAEINSPELVKSIEELGLNVYYLKNPTDFEGLFNNIKTVGQLLSHENEAEELVTELQSRLDMINHILESAETTPKVFYEIDATDPAKPWSVGSGTYHDTIIGMAKGVNIASSAESMYPQISLEEIIVQNPDFIFLADALWGVTPRTGCLTRRLGIDQSCCGWQCHPL